MSMRHGATPPRAAAWLRWAAWSLWLALAGACQDGRVSAPDACVPQCGEACGVEDGCGGTCCPGKVRNAAGDWVEPDACHDSCASVGAACGSVCGERCGSCAAGERCADGRCECAPSCDGTRCDDGCGGPCTCGAGDVCAADGRCVPEAECTDSCASLGASCGEVCGKPCGQCAAGQACAAGACVAPVSCADCALRLTVLEDPALTDAYDQVAVAIDYAPVEGAPLPRMAELRLRAEGDVELLSAETGEALERAGKALYRDPFTGLAFKRAADGAYRMVVYGASSAAPISAGRLALLKLRVGQGAPARLSLQRREQTFAPASADALLQASSYDLPLQVRP